MRDQLNSWVRRVVAFDTNAYRSLAFRASPEEARWKARVLVERERTHGIQALTYPTVLWELMAHLDSPTDPSYGVAKAAVVAAVEHTSVPIGDVKHPAIWLSPDLQLCRSLWDVTPKKLLETDDLLRGIAARVAQDPSEAALDRIRQDLVAVSHKVKDAERDFAMSMQQHLMANLEAEACARGSRPSRKDLLRAYVGNLGTERAREAVALAHVLRAMSYTEVTETPEETQQKARWVADKFRVAVTLYTEVVGKITRSDWDLTTGKGPNYLWDLQVAFLVGNEHSVEGRPATIVTDDEDIVGAAATSGARSVIMSYQEYRQSISSSTTAPDVA